MTTPFRIPPVITTGKLGITRTNDDGTSRSWEIVEYDFQWEMCPLDDNLGVTRDGNRTTQIGTATIDGRNATVVVGYNEVTRIPFFSVTVWGDVKEAITYCSFNFEEV